MEFLDLDKFTKNIDPVTTTEFFTKTEEFNPNGLFSEEIFGPVGSNDRRVSFSFINLNCVVIHPSAYKILIQLDRRLEKFFSTEESFSLDENRRLVKDDNGVTGIEEFKKLFPQIKFKGETETRDKFIKKLKDSYNNKRIFISYIPVIPPDFRPAYEDEGGQWVIDNLNDIYISVLRKSFQIKNSGSGPLYDLLNYDVQNSVNKHDEYIRQKLGKKYGTIRSLTLGKRADFTGRAVITPGPDLKGNEVGIPFRMSVKLFEPFIFHIVLRTKRVDNERLNTLFEENLGSGLSTDSLQRVLNSIKNNDKIDEEIKSIIWEATDIAMEGRVLICKRDPVLQAESLRAFYPKLVEGNTIKLSTLQVGGFNADFDGDQMAVYHPITNESQQEAKERMMNPRTPVSSTSVNWEISKEMAVGLYILTKEYSSTNSPFELLEEEIDSINDPTLAVIYRDKTTTAGKAIFNSCLPNDYEFIDELVNKKKANKILTDIIERYDENIANETATKLKNFAFKFSTIFSPSITLDNIQIPTEIMELKQKLIGATSEEAAELLDQMLSILKEHLKGTGLYDLVDSGSSKGWGQPMQILVSKGVIADTEGNLLEPIKAAFSEGLSPTDYFKASAGARAGIVDRVHNTADTGYLSRKLAYLLSPVEADPSIRDCKTKGYLTVKLNKDILGRLDGRYIVNEKGQPELFKKENFEDGDIVNLRSPIFCKIYKLCQICYGKLLQRHKSPYVGILASQAIGERSTQLVMQTFHTGGTAKITKRNILQDVVENDPQSGLKVGDTID